MDVAALTQWPTGHAVQTAPPPSSPAAQAMQAVVPPTARWIDVQGVHAADPATVVMLPSGQFTQSPATVLPTLDEYMPAAQGTGCVLRPVQ